MATLIARMDLTKTTAKTARKLLFPGTCRDGILGHALFETQNVHNFMLITPVSWIQFLESMK